MTDFPEGGSFRASSTSSLDPMGDWLASADDPFLASSSTVLPNRMESRTGYSPLSMGREEFREHEQTHEAYDGTWSRPGQPSISQPSTHQQQLGLDPGPAPPSSHATIKRPLSSSSDSMLDVTSDSAPPLNSTAFSRFVSATTPERSASVHGAYLSHLPAAHEHGHHLPESSEPLTVWGRPEDSEPTLNDEKSP
ncbi:hypothetical protein LTR12_016352 [Friedmanniomyces endolithicus]|nr:hypothetical protein LTR12_016352 [Friedmanniomyces endolithicus]